MSERDAYIDGLRDLAEWLEKNPTVTVPSSDKLLLPLHTNEAVEQFAAEHGVTFAIDENGNASLDFDFGPITYHAYGYADFKQYCADHDERRAREWADGNGMTIRPAANGSASGGHLARVPHTRIAAELRETPGEWAPVAAYTTFGSARQMASHVRKGRMTAYPAGEFEARVDRAHGDNQLYVRYVGKEATS